MISVRNIKNTYLKRMRYARFFTILVIGLGFCSLSAMESTGDVELDRAILASLEVTTVPVVGAPADTLASRHMHLRNVLNAVRAVRGELDIRCYVSKLGVPARSADVIYARRSFDQVNDERMGLRDFLRGLVHKEQMSKEEADAQLAEFDRAHDFIGVLSRMESGLDSMAALGGLLDYLLSKERIEEISPHDIKFIMTRFTAERSNQEFERWPASPVGEFFPRERQVRADALAQDIKHMMDPHAVDLMRARIEDMGLIEQDLYLKRAFYHRSFIIACAQYQNSVLTGQGMPELWMPEMCREVSGYFEREINSFGHSTTTATSSSHVAVPLPPVARTPVFFPYAQTWIPNEKYEDNREALLQTVLGLAVGVRTSIPQLCEFYTVFATHCCSPDFDENVRFFIKFESALSAPQELPRASIVRPVAVRPTAPVKSIDLVELKGRVQSLVEKIRIYAEKANNAAKKAERVVLDAELDDLKHGAERTVAADAINTLSIPSVNKVGPFIPKRRLIEYLA